ncbi:hypothetical protein BDA96_05G221100 [Sorghum bicolor]|uniref:Rapid alkalinization factor 1 n=1 Tax=Sorghum bicolor TaxID=4558 RepID=A0A921UG69_SORBI|nr:hypothetical protein BDA96_05G221100 [Sorghum bicolor]
MAAAKPLLVVIAFLLAAAAGVPLPDSGGEVPPFTLLPAEAEPPAVSFPDGGGRPPFTLLPADPAAAAGCRGPVGMCPASDEVRGLGARKGAAASTMSMSADPELVRRRVHHQQRDSVPCSRRGASYYNCRPGALANPYRRACSRIKNCHG